MIGALILLLSFVIIPNEPCVDNNKYACIQTDHGSSDLFKAASSAQRDLMRLIHLRSRHIHSAAGHFHSGQLVALYTDGTDNQPDGLEGSPFLFLTTHSRPESWQIVNGTSVKLSNVIAGNGSLRYLLLIGCRIMAHGPLKDGD